MDRRIDPPRPCCDTDQATHRTPVPTDNPPLTPDLQAALQHQIVRAFFISVALVCLFAAVVAPLLGGPQPPLVRAVTVLG